MCVKVPLWDKTYRMDEIRLTDGVLRNIISFHSLQEDLLDGLG